MTNDTETTTLVCRNKRCEAVIENVPVHHEMTTSKGVLMRIYIARCPYCGKETDTTHFFRDGKRIG